MTRPRSPLSRARRPGRQALPRLEALEDRSVPSAGALDPAFNGGSFQSVDGINVLAVAVQPDSKIVVAGTIHTSTYAFAFHFIDHYYMAVARLNAAAATSDWPSALSLFASLRCLRAWP